MSGHVEVLRRIRARAEYRLREAQGRAEADPIREQAAALDHAIATIEQHAALVARLGEGWIAVEDRLPIDAATFTGVYETVQVLAFDGTRVAETMFQAGNGAGKPWAGFGHYEVLRPGRITHWMPLPAPPSADDLARVVAGNGGGDGR